MAFFFTLSFRSLGNAEQTAQRYLREVPGFCDYDCDYHIHKIELDCSDNISHIYAYEGWNEDNDGDVLDQIRGIYPYKDQAESALEAAKLAHSRQFWTLDCLEIGACEWAEGFDRVLLDPPADPELGSIEYEISPQ